MTELSVGALFADLEFRTTQFETAYARVQKMLTDLGAKFERTAAQSATLDEGMAGAAAAADKTAAAAAKVAGAQDKAAVSTRAATTAQERLATVLAGVSDQSLRVQQATLRQAAAQERAAIAAGSGDKAYARLAAAQASLIGSQRSLAAAQDGVAARFAESQQKMTNAGRTMTHTLTLPIVAAAGLSLKSAMDFQKATNVYVTAAGESQSNLATVRDGIKRVAVETGTSIDQLTSAEYLAEKAHLRGAAGITVLEAAAKGAREENANLADVMQGETSIMASYHLKASDAVAVTNALKTGAGSAKTTMENYVRSLSTVIPVASAAHISLQQTLGALSTLTQHGTSADEATQELANTIRNLQAPNNVAVAAMNQLGISSVNVANNLGKRGLTGTIDYIESHLPKSGLVYLTTMRQMESGTKDLNAMLAKMPPNLAAQSKGFLDGTVSAKDYMKYFKSLGAEGSAQGAQFKTLATNVEGYNTSLRNGTPAQKTIVSELKAMFGGATGLNTVLQLGGQNLAGFKDRVDQAGKSLHDTSTQVEGWASTQQLASVQGDILKEKLHVLAINAGTELIPVFLKLVSVGSSVLGWFSNLSGTQKEVLGWSLGVIAAVGPVISIVSRIGKLGSGFATFAGASEAGATRVALAAQRISVAMAGIGLAYAGTQTKGTGGLLEGALGGAMGGAAIGSFFGPWGTAIGGLAGGLTGLAAHFAMAGDAGQSAGQKAAAAARAAQQRILEQKQAVDDLSTAIYNDTNAIGANAKAQIVADLQKSGTLTQAQNAGLNLQDVTNAAMGNAQAQARLQAQVQKMLLAPNYLPGVGKSGDVTAVLTQLQKEGVLLSDAGKQADQAALAAGNLNLATRAVVDQTARYGSTLDATTVSGQMNVAFIKAHVDALDSELSHGKLTQRGWAEQIVTLQSQLKQYGFNRDGIFQYIDAFSKVPRSVLTKLLADPKNATGAIGNVLRALLAVPPSKSTKVNAFTGAAAANIAAIQGQLANLPSYKQITVGVSQVNVGKGSSTYNSQVPQFHAAGGTIVGPGTGTSDSVLMWGSNGEEVINAKQAAKYRPLLKAINAGIHGFASGGTVSASRAQSAAIAANYATASVALSAVSLNKTTFLWSTFAAQIQHAMDMVNGALRSGVTRSEAIHLEARLAKARQTGRQIEQALIGAEGKQAGKLTSLTNAHTYLSKTGTILGNYSTPAAIGTQLQATEQAAVRAGVPQSFINGLRKQNQQILAQVTSRNQAAGFLAQANQRLLSAQATLRADRSTFTAAISGSFDITQAGANANGTVTGLGILAQQKQAVAKARAFVSGLQRLGKQLPGPYLRGIAAQGPSALPQVQALLSLTPAQLGTLRAENAQLDRYAAQGGSIAAETLDRGAVKQAQANQRLWAQRESNREKRLQTMIHSELHGLQVELTNISGGKLGLIVKTSQNQAGHKPGQKRAGQ